ncbi:hypothetical protein M406DRAFT_326208 [Cryphonectria parasitica EP155]|uniref:Uncharacterized protein n=1 Tax=Cryphonectria parasitica (strain ATCC 38755 / EP155) TaxID=660469 RepID=A0A9P4YCZ3_CRYP1|nr:uncharacterized protein M406DRAFT_326208 [Cryphonectria parasitica EP155]KAF3770786.1 hypothetical protein M406DRAFT_326208 [Cryphonectria parasitica EP155]
MTAIVTDPSPPSTLLLQLQALSSSGGHLAQKKLAGPSSTPPNKKSPLPPAKSSSIQRPLREIRRVVTAIYITQPRQGKELNAPRPAPASFTVMDKIFLPLRGGLVTGLSRHPVTRALVFALPDMQLYAPSQAEAYILEAIEVRGTLVESSFPAEALQANCV